MIVLDSTIVNVALPEIRTDLQFTRTGLVWVVNSYLIAFGGLLMLSGRLGDYLGKRRIFCTGLALFCGASLVCGMAATPLTLVAARFLQGAGAAMAASVILGMIVTMYPGNREQARAIGVFSFTASAGGSLGMLAGGVLTEVANWHWIFFVNLPIGAVTIVATMRLVQQDPGVGLSRELDVAGALLVTAAVMLTVYVIVSPATGEGWSSPKTIVLAAMAVMLFAMFILRESTAANPMVPMRIFADRNVAAANVVQALAAGGIYGCFFIQVLFLQGSKDYDALRLGLAFIPCTVVIAALSFRLAGNFAERFGARNVLLGGLTALLLGEVCFAAFNEASSYISQILPALLIIGIGIGLTLPSLTVLAMTSAEPGDAGLVSGLVNTTLQGGGAIGVAVLASVAAAQAIPSEAEGHGFHIAFVVGSSFVTAALAAALVSIRNRTEATGVGREVVRSSQQELASAPHRFSKEN